MKRIRNQWWRRPFKRPKTRKCAWCKKSFKVKPRGRAADFCSNSCRQRSYERRKWQRPQLVEAWARDIATVQVRDFIRGEIWTLLQQAGLVAPKAPVPSVPKPTSKPRPRLRLVEDEFDKEN